MYQPKFAFRLAGSYARKNRVSIAYAIMSEMLMWAILISLLVSYAGSYLVTPIYYALVAFDTVFGWLPYVSISSPEHLAMAYERWVQSTDGFSIFKNVSILVLIVSPILLMLEIMIVRPEVKS